MNKVYVLINIKRGAVKNVENAVGNISEVTESSLVSGRYDMFAKLEGESLSNITEVILNKIHKIEGVERTETLIALSLDISGEEGSPIRTM